MRPALLPLLLVLAPLLGGCVGNDGPGYTREICLEQGYHLKWRQPDVRDALLAAAERERLEVTSFTLAAGLPFVEPAMGLDPGEAQVVFASWQPEGGDPTRLHLVLGAMPEMGPDAWWLEARNLPPDAESTDAIRRFLSWFGLGQDPDGETWIREILRQNEEAPERRGGYVEIQAQPDVGAFMAMLRAEREPRIEHAILGTMALKWERHTLLVHLDVREVTIPIDGTRLRLQTDSLGLVQAATTVPAPDLAHATLLDRTERVFRDLDLPAPTWNDASGGGAGC